MGIFNYKFTPGLWPTLIFVLVFPLFIALGFWQLDRADQKTAYQQQYLDQRKKPPLYLQEIKQSGLVDELTWRKVVVDDEVVLDTDILLDNKIVNGKAGYYIYKPVAVKGTNKKVLINLGWQQAELRRDTVPDLRSFGSLKGIEGYIKQPQFSGVQFSETPVEKLSENIYRVQHIDFEQLEEYFNFKLERYVIRVSNGTDLGYHTEWYEPGFGQEKHLGYAFQWFSFATVLFILFIILNLKRGDI